LAGVTAIAAGTASAAIAVAVALVKVRIRRAITISFLRRPLLVGRNEPRVRR
jgi:hypothetical protein